MTPPIGVIGMQIASGLSMLSSGSILLVITGLQLTQKLFLQLVFHIALCDFGSAFALVIGGTSSQSIACYVQGIVNNYFSLASFFWTITIGYEVYLVIWYQCVQTDLTLITYINWIVPLILSLIPLSTSTYGNDDGTPGWCFFNSQSQYESMEWIEIVWYIISFYLWIYLAIFYLLYVSAMSAYKLYYLQRGMETDAHLVVERIIYYPVIVIVCWVVSSLIDIGLLVGMDLPVGGDDPFSVAFTYILPNLQGFFSGIAFFISNPDVIEELVKKLQDKGWISKPPVDENENDEDLGIDDGAPVADHEGTTSRPVSSRLPSMSQRMTNPSLDYEGDVEGRADSEIEMSDTSSFHATSARESSEGNIRSSRLSVRKSVASAPLQSITEEGDDNENDEECAATNNPMLTANALMDESIVSSTERLRPVSMDSIASSMSAYEAKRRLAQLNQQQNTNGSKHSQDTSITSSQPPSHSSDANTSHLESLRDIQSSRNNSNWFERNLFRQSSSSMQGMIFRNKKKKGTVYSSNSLLASDIR